MRTAATLGHRHRPLHRQQAQSPWWASPGPRSVERVAAGARTRRVGVVDGEALLLDRVNEVDRGTGEVRGTHLVGDNMHTLVGGPHVAVDVPLVEVQLVAEAGAA